MVAKCAVCNIWLYSVQCEMCLMPAVESSEGEEDDPWSVELAFHLLAPPSLTSLLPLAEHYGAEQRQTCKMSPSTPSGMV